MTGAGVESFPTPGTEQPEEAKVKDESALAAADEVKRLSASSNQPLEEEPDSGGAAGSKDDDGGVDWYTDVGDAPHH